MTGSSKWVTRERRLALYIRDRFTCGYCGKDLRDAKPEEMGLDHLEGLVDGGGHRGSNNASANLTTACRRCNSQRGAKAWRDYCSAGAQDRIEANRQTPVNLELAKALLSSGTKWSDQ